MKNEEIVNSLTGDKLFIMTVSSRLDGLLNQARKSERAKVIEEIEKWFAENKDIQTTNSRVMIRRLLTSLKGEG